MKKDLQDLLFTRYPKIFRQKDLCSKTSSMSDGIKCGDGWYQLIQDMCEQIQNRVNYINSRRQQQIKNHPKTLIPITTHEFLCEATQVKEKFGGLRFYFDGGDDFIKGVVSLAESLSYKVCSSCGKYKNFENKRGWIYTKCKNCRAANK
jgi:hypothetical protein